ncbi:protein of unknown function (plasmid) [Cupriavidus taiwanensis]|uniref:AMP-binding enzyme C-terminal domain-containing protein n=2 Tax=Cupriavidus TaxID=106589 RepID=A0A375HT44_9BURK|nr:hypothetical protein CT19431_P20057 [Cupriavidus taiwanensis]SPD61329.1 protein of unknown function [Cupriavidus taiwanensis]SPD62074.1 protein of unknown function [Cupriavidus neocaledonicus]SPD69161.1 protein of unknown function [Cupriavidus taiwanensis]
MRSSTRNASPTLIVKILLAHRSIDGEPLPALHTKKLTGPVYGPLPKTGTGKIQKYRLREIACSRDAITDLARSQ